MSLDDLLAMAHTDDLEIRAMRTRKTRSSGRILIRVIKTASNTITCEGEIIDVEPEHVLSEI
jgi:hypothetical protein